jgi:hypothetical protein
MVHCVLVDHHDIMTGCWCCGTAAAVPVRNASWLLLSWDPSPNKDLKAANCDRFGFNLRMTLANNAMDTFAPATCDYYTLSRIGSGFPT